MEPADADGARRASCRKLANLIDENSETLAHLLTAEGGKLLPESRIDAGFASLLLRYAAESARRLEGELLPGENRDEQIWIYRVPYGVVAGITAWNFPAALFARKVGPALVTGNTIVVKPHELTPLTTLVLGELSRRAGIPEGVHQRGGRRRPDGRRPSRLPQGHRSRVHDGQRPSGRRDLRARRGAHQADPPRARRQGAVHRDG